jgi:predicted dehydrogenase
MDNSDSKNSPLNFSRREFLGTMAATAAFTIIPRHALGGVGYTAPSDMVNLAAIGIGSQGGGDIQNIATPDVPIQRRQGGGVTMLMERYAGLTPPRRQFRQSDAPVQMGDAGRATFHHANIYALCDVDWDYAGHIMAGYPKAKKYHDWREMLDKEKEIDAVLIGTPDHTHAIISAYFMKAGKHVFVEKPMAKTIYECRYLRDLAKKTGVVTQMGNQGHNVDGTMQTIEWIKACVIGDVREVHMWSNRPSWPQGYLQRPPAEPVPSNLKYDLWLGPAKDAPYNASCVHFNWRGLWDYGTGAMGDMGAHTFDAPILALDLGMPTRIQTTSTPFNDVYLPKSEFACYDFPARNGKPAVRVTWNDGGNKYPRPLQLEDGRALRECLYIGDKGMIMHGTHGAKPELIPNDPNFKEPAKTLPRPKSVYVDFIEAIKEGRKAHNDFAIASKLTEIMLLTNIGLMSQNMNTTLEYDEANMKITNLPDADQFFHYQYRSGWSLPAL